ncbi:Spy/CpxP family protein refolding chaperone [Brachyspira sp.]|uniref:Spy/CpxP family protein refolding chaperone n=1 Tax=Brachyspira sp. TaxID=1977261 RepID=UPI003D7CCE73
MTKKILTTIILSMLAVSSVFAQPPVPPAQNGYQPAPRHERRQDRHVRGVRGLEWINLTEEQRNEINKLDYDYETKIREVEYRKRGVDYKFEYEREKADIDLATIKDLINQRKDIEKEIDYLRIEKEVSILNVLTPEQKEQLNYGRRYR